MPIRNWIQTCVCLIVGACKTLAWWTEPTACTFVVWPNIITHKLTTQHQYVGHTEHTSLTRTFTAHTFSKYRLLGLNAYACNSSNAEQRPSWLLFWNFRMSTVQRWKKPSHRNSFQTTSVGASWHCYRKLGAGWRGVQLRAAYVPAATALIAVAPDTDGILAPAKSIALRTIH